MFMANEVTPFAAPLSVGNKLLFARLLASLRLALVRHKRMLAASDVSVLIATKSRPPEGLWILKTPEGVKV
jgi:hypothetical protein